MRFIAKITTQKNKTKYLRNSVKLLKYVKKYPKDIKGDRMQLKIKWEKTRRGYYAWQCLYGNIITQSSISAEKCFQNTLAKLKSKGIDIHKFDPTPKIIDERK